VTRRVERSSTRTIRPVE